MKMSVVSWRTSGRLYSVMVSVHVVMNVIIVAFCHCNYVVCSTLDSGENSSDLFRRTKSFNLYRLSIVICV